jgi:hypothetical protein
MMPLTRFGKDRQQSLLSSVIKWILGNQHISLDETYHNLDVTLHSLSPGAVQSQQELLARFIDHIFVYPDHLEVFFKFKIVRAPSPAAAKPAGPPPTIKTSYSSSMKTLL